MNKGKSVLFILLAGIIALVGTYFVFSFVSSQREAFQKKLAEMKSAPVEEGSVIYTKVDIGQQAQLTAEMLEVRKIPLNFVPADAVTTLEGAEGQCARVPLVKDEPVRLSKLVNKAGASGLPFRIPEGKRAVTILMTEPKAVAYNINPGDRVDVMGIFAKPLDEGGGKKETGPLCVTVLQNIEVLDVTAANIEEATNKRTGSPSATLAVDPTEAEVIALVDSQATLVLSLRQANDDKPFKSGGITLAEVMGQKVGAPPTLAPPPAPGPTIQVFSGNSVQQIQVPK